MKYKTSIYFVIIIAFLLLMLVACDRLHSYRIVDESCRIIDHESYRYECNISDMVVRTQCSAIAPDILYLSLVLINTRKNDVSYRLSELQTYHNNAMLENFDWRLNGAKLEDLRQLLIQTGDSISFDFSVRHPSKLKEIKNLTVEIGNYYVVNTGDTISLGSLKFEFVED